MKSNNGIKRREAASKLQPPPTDKIQTNLLWGRVRRRKEMSQNMTPSYLRPTNASLSRRQPHLSVGDTPSRSATTTASSRKQAPIRVTDKNFRDILLHRYGVEVREEDTRFALGAYQHFGTASAPQGDAETMKRWYHGQLGCEDANVWLPLTQEEAHRVAQQYGRMAHADENEAKFSFYGKIHFFRQDVAHDPQMSERSRQTYCKMEWAPKPSPQKQLYCPPAVQHSGAASEPDTRQFSFDNKPDLTFWLPLSMFNVLYRDCVTLLTYTISKAEVTAPYFTIEFKKDEEDFVSAVNQLSAAAALILYNRILLRICRLKAFNRSHLASDDFDGLVHYGIAFTANAATIYKIEPKLTLDTTPPTPVSQQHKHVDIMGAIWAGCVVRRIHRVVVSRPEGVIALRTWINEIQHWGLSKYADDFVVDVKGVLRKNDGGIERISLLPNEVKALGLTDSETKVPT